MSSFFPTSPIFTQAPDWSGKAGFGSGPPEWIKQVGLVDPDVVHLQGAVAQTSASGGDPNLLGTLPAAACPDRIVYTIVHTFDGTYADVAISPNGQINLINPRQPAVTDFSFVSLEGITYEQFLPVANLVPVNAPDWSTDAGFGSAAPAFYQDGNGFVHLQGAAAQVSASGSNPNLLGTLPPAARPFNDVYTIVHTFNGTYADLSIGTDGSINIISPRPPAVEDLQFVSLEGITFFVGDQGFPVAIPVNAPDWSATAGFGSAAPAWIATQFADGFVHLQGAAKQVSASGPNPNLLGTLPAAARPTRDVYTIVHTFNGTYADLSIGTDGSINIISPRPPAVEDLQFVSLEGISYQR
jgi:hypothetical protein